MKILIAFAVTGWLLGCTVTVANSDSGGDAFAGCVMSAIMGILLALLLGLLFLLWGWALT